MQQNSSISSTNSFHFASFSLQPCSTVTATTSDEGKTEDAEFKAKILYQKEGKKTWQEFKEIVCELRKQLSSLSSMAPTSIAFRTYPDGRTRIFFLGSPCNGLETTLLYADIPKDEDTQPTARLTWFPVIESIATTSKFSREEQLMLERKRLATWGITSYELHEDSGKLVFPASSTLFHCTDTGFSVGVDWMINRVRAAEADRISFRFHILISFQRLISVSKMTLSASSFWLRNYKN